MNRLFVTCATFATLALTGAVSAQGPAPAQAPSASAPARTVSPAKKEAVQKFVALQLPSIENAARGLVERSVAQMAQEVRGALQQMPADKREAAAKAIDADIKKYIDEATPVVRERALKLVPSTFTTGLEEKFSEDEIKQLTAWFESPLFKKYGQFNAELQGNFMQKLVIEVGPLIDPKLQGLLVKVRAALGAPAAAASAAPAAKKPSAK